jgi:hypothetical protein
MLSNVTMVSYFLGYDDPKDDPEILVLRCKPVYVE